MRLWNQRNLSSNSCFPPVNSLSLVNLCEAPIFICKYGLIIILSKNAENNNLCFRHSLHCLVVISMVKSILFLHSMKTRSNYFGIEKEWKYFLLVNQPLILMFFYTYTHSFKCQYNLEVFNYFESTEYNLHFTISNNFHLTEIHLIILDCPFCPKFSSLIPPCFSTQCESLLSIKYCCKWCKYYVQRTLTHLSRMRKLSYGGRDSIDS